MDPFDEFEFKPLTDGLGFHKKPVSLKDGLKRSGVVEEELQSIPVRAPKGLLEDAPKVSGKPATPKKHTFEEVLAALEKTPLARSATAKLDFTEPLPREKKKAMDVEVPRSPSPVQSPFPQPEAFRSPQLNRAPVTPNMQKQELAKTGTRRGAADSPRRNLFPAAFSIAPAILDLIIVIALSLIFVVALLVVTKVDLNIVYRNLGRDQMTKLSLFAMFVAVMQMYMIVARSFFGRTVGEWTFDMQLGEDDQQKSEMYPLRVAFRSLINTGTGLVTLPILSFLMNRDLAGRLSGVQLYRQRS